MAYQPPIGSTVAFQSDPTKLVGTVSVIQANQSVSGTVNVGNLPTTQNVSGSVYAVGSITALQGTNPWHVQLTSGSVITAGGNSSVQVVGTMPPQSVSGVGTFNVNPVGSGSVYAVLRDSSVAALQGTNPWVVQLTSGSVITTGGNSSVQVVGAMPPQSVSGVGTFNINPIGNGSVFAKLTNSSVTAYQGVTPWVTVGSVQGTMSVIGTVPVTGFRNDAVASTVGVNLTARSFATDSAGRILTKPLAPVEASVVATASTVNAGFGTNQAASVRVLAAPGAGLKWYITDFNLSNTGTATTLVTLTDDFSNTLWKGVVPAGGGNNMPGLTTPVVSASPNTPLGLVSGTASSVIHLWVSGYKAP